MKERSIDVPSVLHIRRPAIAVFCPSCAAQQTWPSNDCPARHQSYALFACLSLWSCAFAPSKAQPPIKSTASPSKAQPPLQKHSLTFKSTASPSTAPHNCGLRAHGTAQLWTLRARHCTTVDSARTAPHNCGLGAHGNAQLWTRRKQPACPHSSCAHSSAEFV